MSAKHTPGPLFVSVEPEWPFWIVTKNSAGDVVFSRDMPSHSTKQKSADEALAGKGIPPEWNAAESNASALADEVLRAAAPELLEALKLWMTIHESAAGFAGKYGKELDIAIAAQQVKVEAASKAGSAAIAKATGGQP